MGKCIKLGVDIRNLTKPLTGIGKYTLELCIELSKIDTFKLYLYAPSAILKPYKNKLGDTIIKTSCFKTKIARQIWAETILPYQIYKDDIDIFWGPAHRLPCFLPKSIKKALTIHDLVWKYYPQTMSKKTLLLDKFFMPLSIKKADIILADSFSTKKDLLKEFVFAKKKVSVLYPGTRKANVSKSDKIENLPEKYILFIGTLEPRKNLHRLLEAYALLDNETREKHNLVIVGGNGWGDVNLTKKINDLQINVFCHLIGYIEEHFLPNLYKNCLFLALPSLYEGFGFPIAEAIQYGKPVLTSNNSSMEEIVGENGILINPLSVDSIYSGLKNIIQNPKTFKPEIKFSWEDSAKQFKEAIEDLYKQKI